MKKSKIITLLSQLSVREQIRFKDYVHAAFFNKHEATQRLLDCLLTFAPDFQSEKMNKAAVYGQVFPNKTYQEVKLNYVISKLVDLLSDFLAYEEYATNKYRKKYYSLKAVHRLQVPKQEASLIRKYELLQEQQWYVEASDYYEQFLFYGIRNQIHLGKEQRLFDANLQLQNNALDYFYFAQKLKIACDMLSRNVVIQANYEATYIETLVGQVEDAAFNMEEHPCIHIYYQILKTLKGGLESDYQVLKELIEQYATVFLPDELLLIYDYAENYCIRQINNGAIHFYYEFLDLYKQKLERDLLLKDGYLPESDYKNIVTAGVRIKDFEWVERFIHERKKQLHPDVQENAFNYNLAVFYYATKQYTEALRLLVTIHFTDIAYGVGAKNIQLQSYYELEEFEALLSLLDTFRLYVRRHKTQSDYRKKANLNMLKIVKKVVKLKEKSMTITTKQLEKEKEVLIQLYETTSPLSNADWIQRIIAEL